MSPARSLALCLAFAAPQRSLPLSHPAVTRRAAARSPLAIAIQRCCTPSAVASADVTALPRLPTLPLPELDANDLALLVEGERVQRQQLNPDGFGSGFSVQDVRAAPDVVWEAVSDFDGYAGRIKTVRTATRYAAEPESKEAVCYNFLVSRIRLILNVRFTVDNEARRASWELDKRSWVLEDSTGYWLVQALPSRPGFVRVWFCVSVRLNKRVPGFVVRLVSRLGLSKATKWIRDLQVV